MNLKLAYQFKVELLGITPSLWRIIEVPSTYSFWDLHVAIQDAMGWLDYHLHSFSIVPPRKRKAIKIGIPDDEAEEEIQPGWEVPIADFFHQPGDHARYDYDFGDDWSHNVTLLGILLQEEDKKYPNCTAGERACPPEDCGGVPGYYRLLESLSKPESKEHEEMVFWLSNHAKKYWPYNPDEFAAQAVEFWDPKKRLKMAFE
jgi:hypothetical protein